MIFRVDLTFASLGARRYSDGAKAVESFKLLSDAFHFNSQINTLDKLARGTTCAD